MLEISEIDLKVLLSLSKHGVKCAQKAEQMKFLEDKKYLAIDFSRSQNQDLENTLYKIAEKFGLKEVLEKL